VTTTPTSLPYIVLTNVATADAVATVNDYLDAAKQWINGTFPTTFEEGALSRIWYRGVGDMRDNAFPGIYRDDPNCKFTTQAHARSYGSGEEKRRNLERSIVSEFRTLAVSLVDPNDFITVYLMAQHYGLPTRLLDWTTNPLAALFFAVSGLDETKRGEVILMDALETLLPKGSGDERPLPNILEPIRILRVAIGT
jgi:FRG domain